jgi:N-acetylmuramoyl-L-alanine amidase
MVQIKQQYVPSNKRNATFGTGNPRKKMVVHQTGNRATGANAQMHADLQARGWGASWHIQSDDKEIIQSWPLTYRLYHASTGRASNGGNWVGIGWEICINQDGDYLKALDLAAEGIAQVMKQEGIPMSGLTTHNAEDPRNKWCPAQILNGKDGVNWATFRSMVQSYYNGKTPTQPKSSGSSSSGSSGSSVAGARLVKNENAYFLATENIKVRNAPSTNARHTGTLPKGSSINYHKVYEGNGYRWLQYTGNSGNTLYVPYRPSNDINNQWGTFHSTRPSSTSPKPKPKPKAKKYPLPNATYWVKNPPSARFNGKGVRQVQTALASIHFYPNKGAKNNGVDGWYGPDTADAVQRFQSMHGLKQDGSYGPATKKVLDREVN